MQDVVGTYFDGPLGHIPYRWAGRVVCGGFDWEMVQHLERIVTEATAPEQLAGDVEAALKQREMAKTAVECADA